METEGPGQAGGSEDAVSGQAGGQEAPSSRQSGGWKALGQAGGERRALPTERPAGYIGLHYVNYCLSLKSS